MVIKAHLLTSFDDEWIGKLKDKLSPDIRLTHGLELPSPADFSVLIAGVPKREDIVASPELHTLIIP